MMRDEMVLIVSPNHAWAGRKVGAIAPAELASVPLLLRERGSGSRRVVERALKNAGLPLRSLKVTMELDSTEAIISGVEAELGVGFVSRCAVNKVLRLGSVKLVHVEGMEILRDFSFARLAGDESSGTAAAFQRFAMGALAGGS
jgi:DNA-binding transcriptional LysR family regulator